ncbi:hypothetical protein OEG84_25110 [Hoeflea sp. G2-23]|uniref:Head-to-tail stopper n=1 Tax=Hoeflea algicola TaxID=2983763 RepID=A0ABT3ZGW9_9HYPH|nr:hypothetical protein [Hoeflea algicola]MCY0150888.1 hypothetical protein [Hoeflea algicola]
MAEDWNAVAVDVAAGLIEAGTTATIIRAGTPTGPAHNPTPYACTVVYDQWRADQIDGTLIQRGDLKILVAASDLAITPTPADTFKDGDGKEYAIINVTPLQPAGVAVMYEIQARG